MKSILFLILLSATSAFSAGKDYVPGFVLLNATSMATDITSADVDTRAWDNIDIELIATGTPTGSFFVDCTLFPTMPPALSAQKWVAVPLSPSPIAVGAPTNIIIELNQMGCMFVRVRYTATMGTGSLTAYIGEKQI